MTKKNKGRFLARISYDSDFEPDMKLFKELITNDKRFVSKKNKKQRFSAAIRYFIVIYNKKYGGKNVKTDKNQDTQEDAGSD